MKGKDMTKQENPIMNTERLLQTTLKFIVSEVAEQEGIGVEVLPSQFEHYFMPADLASGVRCVDDRRPQDNFIDSYTGVQFPGGSNGELSVLRGITGMNEEQGRQVIVATNDKNGRRLGNHNDDRHGEITDPAELEARTEGCGAEDKSAEGAILMFSDLNLGPEVKRQRIVWLKENGGSFPALTGHHDAKGAGINLESGTTFNTREAVNDGNSIFGLDLRDVWDFAPKYYQDLPQEFKRQISEKDFQRQMTEGMVRHYLQTLKALNGPKTVWIRETNS